ncbi:hypothetical protein COCC4DRAFT_35116 [Bipolaris maydis ATCC 48331]|uniref:Uncharacterized protein n=2 Tax=Cochliobolus heterostrophus TaxID=5016 RepID=M2V125_COCH5|nr:uncharacterized protein COCC4DRAFT_35116 [Bipolaris maydis ATCC 48331]EMD93667.1 hypothetical protein COCHEDRAFT_1020610 [Bipolaris maydis C5]ENH98809.1 hypothetical protein COCC4DRAFT_35116 [Bipolaris maydis ATCC 48331]
MPANRWKKRHDMTIRIWDLLGVPIWNRRMTSLASLVGLRFAKEYYTNPDLHMQ